MNSLGMRIVHKIRGIFRKTLRLILGLRVQDVRHD
ncbi:hypothetical protein CBM2631_A10112 [Cupriavidus taiwanensis]|nr:hypothetical protein CBM2588_A10112 [Cupriavidus taiwanensis]SOZ50311.1 hypothetical protein CBM2617_A10061 [Cupriavidus taiwanensis]SOZ75657.1 hypothetical protein CBM2622_A10062 [Cupriavidus taiwanensis]SOZ76126.1 hypothetical protein CBM2618_A10061 [Cupriavidus taiwanensis]SOZ79288.1 hypothetical protein CBM2621_A10063 [Cupriavidus taiwanensis]